ncbi:uncharacterized protein DUF397 [Herbihabitans rhizosphaerae]|uniref:Uncharacterized protein DUF397 n=1 Tax=Herbihabitans rhizosphaerae TaxID=1872711 RepID=A0A4Q7KCV9_9PSEU|nr:DUF397 domain-containing protein [Herbihabitans rhizosphaerae]RZS30526.1 uncharacterized protein DUF397 [Herbihabitans rhizosphaerae]
MPAMDLTDLRWRKSSRSSDGSNHDCVEVAVAGDMTALRDSKNPSGPLLMVPASGYTSFNRWTSA